MKTIKGVSNAQVTFRADLKTPVVQTDYDPYHKATGGKTAYQQNVSNPVPAYKAPETTRDVLGQIYNLGRFDKSKAEEIMSTFGQLRTRKDSRFYDPYAQPTNKAIGVLRDLGMNVDTINDDWFNQNSWLKQYYVETANTNGLSSTMSNKKKSSKEEQAAYQYNQLWMAEDSTKKAEQEWAALQEELSFFANDPHNYSDDEIIDQIDWSKYKTLQKMDDTKNQGTPMELNRAVGYSKDAMYGVLWAARNGGGTGDSYADMANSALGTGKVWEYNQDTVDRMNPKSEKFAPYSFGSTMKDACLYYGKPSFTKEEVADIAQNVWSTDETEAKIARRIVAAEEFTVSAEDAISALDNWMIEKTKDLSADEAKKELDKALTKGYIWIGTGKNRQKVDISVLNKLDKTIGKEDKAGTGDLLETTRALNYKYADALKKYQDLCAGESRKTSTIDESKHIFDISTNPAVPTAGPKQGEQPDKSITETIKPAQDIIDQSEEQKGGMEIPTNVKTPTDLQPAGVNETGTDVNFSGSAASAAKTNVQGAGSDFDFSDSTIATVKANDKKIGAVGDLIGGNLTEGEQETWKNAGSSFWSKSKQMFQTALQNYETSKSMAIDAGEKVKANYFNTALETMYDVGKYNATSEQLTADKERYATLETKWGDVSYLQKEFEPTKSFYVGDINVTIAFNEQTNQYEITNMFDRARNLTMDEIIDYGNDQENIAEAERIVKEETAEAIKIRNAHAMMDSMGDEGKAEVQEYKNLSAQIQYEEEYLKENKDSVDQQNMQLLKDRLSLGAVSVALGWYGADKSGIDQAYVYLEYLSQFYDEPPLPNSPETKLEYFDRLSETFGKEYTTEEKSKKIQESISDIDKRIDYIHMAQEYLESNGMQVPDAIKRNMQYTLEDLQNERKAFEYSAILTDTNPEELNKAIEAGKAFEKKYEGQMHYWANLFPNADYFYTLREQDRYRDDYDIVKQEDEDTYYYLLGKKVLEMGEDLDKAIGQIGQNQGVAEAALREVFKDAGDYQHFMEDDESGFGVWVLRENERSAQYGENLVNSGFAGGALANVGGTMVTPLESIASALYLLDKAVFGGRINANTSARRLSIFKESTRAATFESINQTYKDNPIMKKLASLGYEIYSNRGDSLMNSLAFGWLIPGSGMLSEFAGAAPMGATAALNAAAEAVQRGASTDQAWLIAGATFLAETATEAITFSNIKEALGTAEGLTGDSLKSFFKDWLTRSGLEEMLGESTNDLIENAADRWVMRDKSQHDAMIKEFVANGYTEEEAEAAAYEQELKGIMHTALVSYLSAGSDVFIKTGKAAINTVNYYRSATKSDQKIGGNGSMLDMMRADWKANKAGTLANAETAMAVDEAIAGEQAVNEQYGNGAEQQTGTERNQALEEATKIGEEQSKQARDRRRNETDLKRGMEAANEQTRQAEARRNQEAKEATPEQKAAAADIIALEESKGGDASVQSSALAAVLEAGNGEAAEGTTYRSDRANAAAANMSKVLGKDALTTVQETIQGAAEGGVSQNLVKVGFQFAAIGNGECTRVVQSDEFKNASPQEKAKMLFMAASRDVVNDKVQQNIGNAITEFRKTKVMTELATEGHFDQAQKDQEAADKAAENTAQAQEELESRENEVQAASDNVTTASKEFSDNPTDENRKQLDQATTELGQKDESQRQYEQHLENEKAKQEEAEAKAQQSAEEATNTARQIAEERVAQEDQQRAEEEKAVNEEKQYKQALIDNGIITPDPVESSTDLFATDEEMEARQRAHFVYHDNKVSYYGNVDAGMEQALTEAGFHKETFGDPETGETGYVYVADRSAVSVETLKSLNDSINEQTDERTGKADEDRRSQLIEQLLDNENLQGEEREERRERLQNQLDKVRVKITDLKQPVSNTEGALALYAFERKLGIPIQFADLGPVDSTRITRGKYENGVIYLNQNLIKSGKMTVGQAMVEASLHEIIHSIRNTNSYNAYRNVVMGSLYGAQNTKDALSLYESNSDYRAAIDTMIADRAAAGDPNFTGDDLNRMIEIADEEIVADFARMNLAEKDVVQRFMDNGLGGRMRNTLHNINQALKNYFSNMTGEERRTAENLRRAERNLQKAINEAAKTSVHPEGGQFSISQFAQSAGLNFNENTLELRDQNGNLIDGVNNRVTADMMNNTPVGLLIDLARDGSKTKKGDVKFAPTISAETAQAQKQMFADLMNMVAQYKDSNLVWEIASSTMFSALKSNSDPQYSTTVDFGTVCAKTQEIINVMSRVMLEKGRGLTREEVLKVYNETANANLTVPCPVCYVFSRWMGVPSLLNQMSQYQKRFVIQNEDGSINMEKTAEEANRYIKAALDKYGSKDKIDDAKTSLVNRMKTQEKNRANALTVLNSETATAEEKAKAQTKHDEAIKNLDILQKELGEVEAYNWVTQALCLQQQKGKTKYNVLDKDGNYVIDPSFELTPDSVLFDLRQTGEFAKYTKNWQYRNTRGAGMGKAIMPYSGESIGDIIFGTDRKTEIMNPFLTQTYTKAADGIKNAVKRAKQQNLIGGQRLQSTSDFRPEWGLDYMMAFLELQAVGSKVQMYTKVAEAVDLLASMGGDINLSIMGKGQGWHTDENGNQVLDFSDVTGMNYETAKELKDKYDNVQMILVGMNDTHIRLALANKDIDFVIPWHSSGNSKDTLASLVSSASIGKEQLETSSDYTDTQSDKESENQTEEQKHLWNLRMKILQGQKLTEADRKTILNDEYLAPLYNRFTVKDVDNDCYKVKLGKDQAKQIFPYEYWNKSLTKDQANGNGQAFIDYCQHFGIVPRFSGVVKTNDDGTFTVTGNFAGAIYDDKGNITGYDPEKMYDGYWKVLIDRPMYDNKGNYRDQQVVDVTKAKIGALENGKLTNSDMPLKTSAMYGPNYSTQEKTAVDNSLAAIEQMEQARMNGGKQSVMGDLTAADQDLMTDAVNDYADAVARGDMEAAQEDVDFYAEQNGYTIKAYHGTAAPFNTFDRSKLGNATGAASAAVGFYLTDSKQVAEKFSKISRDPIARAFGASDNTATVMDLRVKISNPYVYETEIGDSFDLFRDDLFNYAQKYTKNWAYPITTIEGYKTMPPRRLQEIGEAFSNKLEQDGYDGIIIRQTKMDGKEPHDFYIAFEPNQIKSGDPVTYDNNGNVIPLDQRFSDSPDIRYSAEGELTAADRDLMGNLTDTDLDQWFDQYIENMSADELDQLAQEMFGISLNTPTKAKPATEQAEAAPAEQIKEPDLAANFREAYKAAVESGDLYTARNIIDQLAKRAGYTVRGTHRTNADFTVFDRSKQTKNNGATLGDGFYVAAGEGTEYDNEHYGKNRMLVYINPGNVFDIQKGGLTEEQAREVYAKYFAPLHPQSNDAYDDSNPYTSHVVRQLQSEYHVMDYIKEAAENADITTDVIFKELGYNSIKDGPQYCVFDSEQIKSADPITYDQGRMIDLDERFNKNEQDYRYSTEGDLTAADMDLMQEQKDNQTLMDAGALTPEEVKAYEERYHRRPLEGKRPSAGNAQRAFGDVGGMLEKSDEIFNFAKSVVKAQNSYFPDTNNEQINRAIDWIKSLKRAPGSDGYSEALQKVTSESFDYRSSDGQARMVAVMGLAAAKNDTIAQAALADAFNRQGTDLGRALQSRKLFMLMTPEGRISTLQKMLQNAKDEMGKRGKKVDLTFSEWIYQAAAFAETEEDMHKVQLAAMAALGEQLPANWKDRLQSIRMLSMLANPRTHIRNIIGNAMFIPAVSLKNKLGAIMELGMDKGNRTKTLAPVVSQDIRDFAREDASNIKGILTGEAKFNEAAQIKQNQAPLGKFMKALSDLNGNLLEGEDWFFLKGHYRRALGGWIQANGYTVDQVKNDSALLEKGRAYAIQEAQKATYRDFSTAAQTLNQASRKGGAIGFIVDAALPFKKTPINILRRGVEYSPVGIVKSLTYDMYRMKQYMDYQNGKLDVLPEKAMSPNQVIDHFCGGVSGTMVAALGYLLAGAGAVSCGLDDDEDKFEKAKGNQEYAINPGKALNTVFGAKLFGEDVTFTIDWAAPLSMPFFVGAAVRKQMDDEGIVDVNDVFNAIGGMTEPVFNLSMLDGVNSLLKTSSYDDTNPITQIGTKVLTNYVSSFVPSALGAIARTIDDTRRKSFVPADKSQGFIGNMLYAHENAQNKIPIYNQKNIPVRDIWGNKDTTGFAERLLENFILPGYVNEYKEDPIINEMARLYDATGDKKMIPDADPDKKITYTIKSTKEKITHVLTDQEWDKYKEVRNQTAYNELNALLANEDYQKATDAVQAQMIKDIWSHADKVGQKAVIPEIETEESNEATVATIAKDSRIAGYKDEMIKALKAEDYEAYETMAQALYDEGLEESDVMGKIRDYYREQYKDAYRKGLDDRMMEIEEILDNTGFDFEDMIMSWQEKVDEEQGW